MKSVPPNVAPRFSAKSQRNAISAVIVGVRYTQDMYQWGVLQLPTRDSSCPDDGDGTEIILLTCPAQRRRLALQETRDAKPASHESTTEPCAQSFRHLGTYTIRDGIEKQTWTQMSLSSTWNLAIATAAQLSRFKKQI
jgi:hypothetical protein